MIKIRQLADKAIEKYSNLVLNHPIMVIIALILILAGLGYKSLNFKIDASSETLLLENDKDLRFTRQVEARYGVSEFLVISYTPKSKDLLDSKNLDNLARLKDDLEALERVSSVDTILGVPLLQSPPIDYSQFSGTLPNLKSPDVDRALARTELQESEFYKDLLVSADMKTTALKVNLKSDALFKELIEQRRKLQEKNAQGALATDERSRLRRIQKQISHQLDVSRAAQHKNIAAVRAVMDKYRSEADLFLGGIPMIADDMITFIKNDLKIFGLGVFILLVGMLGLIFKRIRWIILPMLCCFLSVIAMMGVLGLLGWKVTVISSNFMSLQLIITLAIVVHLIVRYREFRVNNPEMDQYTLVQNTIRSKFVPCLYAVLTTIAGFSSLMLCDIKPVIHFGWMMSAGIVFSLLLTFVLFPASAVLMQKTKLPRVSKTDRRFSLTSILARFTQSHGRLVLFLTAIVTIIAIMGANRLVVENSFIDYFKQSTEIYQGMKVIDQKLGGTTPLDIIVQFDPIDLTEIEDDAEDDLLDSDPFADELTGGDESSGGKEDTHKYWFADSRMKTIEQVHDYLDALPQTGKVLSLGTLLKIGRELNNGKSLDSIEMAVLYPKLPQRFKTEILSPFLSIENNEVRFSVRIKDSLKGLKRNALINQIRSDLVNKLGLQKDKVYLAGAMILYNNMLQSLFTSQIKTLGVVALVLMLMFLVLFRSLKVALIAMYPNLLSAGAVLGVMGWLNIPLDMMTITIAAISIGIAVDDTIHYIHRFREEIEHGYDYVEAMHRSHSSIGHAMYYTSMIIIIGFSILMFSNFLPMIYFGLFTGLAMFFAMIAALTLLPQLLIVFKPFSVCTDESEK